MVRIQNKNALDTVVLFSLLTGFFISFPHFQRLHRRTGIQEAVFLEKTRVAMWGRLPQWIKVKLMFECVIPLECSHKLATTRHLEHDINSRNAPGQNKT